MKNLNKFIEQAKKLESLTLVELSDTLEDLSLEDLKSFENTMHSLAFGVSDVRVARE